MLGVIIGLLTGNSVHRASSDTFEGSSKRVGTSEGLGFAFNLPKSWESIRAGGCSIEQAMGFLPYLLDFSPSSFISIVEEFSVTSPEIQFLGMGKE